jgi:predicted AAA+ superfamily ATPase
VLRQSGGMLEVTALAKLAGVSRPTVISWLEVLQTTHVAHLLRPFAGGGRREIVAQPKVYGFDTGFVCFARGWDSLRAEDCGLLWEHLVLETLLAIPVARLQFWRDKQQREVDFVVPRGREMVDAIECKWTAGSFEPRGLAAFREGYPAGRNLVVSSDVTEGYSRRFGTLTVEFVSAASLRGILA